MTDCQCGWIIGQNRGNDARVRCTRRGIIIDSCPGNGTTIKDHERLLCPPHYEDVSLLREEIQRFNAAPYGKAECIHGMTQTDECACFKKP
jgi:hypothetical protein